MNIGNSLDLLGRTLEQSRLALQTILKLSPVGIGVTRLRDGMIVGFNDALLDVIGYAWADVAGRSSAELMVWGDAAERTAVFARLAAHETIRELPTTIRRRDGTIRQVWFSATQVELDGEPHMIGSLRDVTDEAVLVAESAAMQRRLQLSLSMTAVALFSQDLDLRYNYVLNSQLGVPADSVLGRLDGDIFDERDAAALVTIKRRVLTAGVGERHVLSVGREGRRRWFDLAIEPEFDADGRTMGILGAAADITESKEREVKLRAIAEDQTELIGRYLPDGTMTYANAAYARFFGKSEGEIVGRSWQPEAHPDDIRMIEDKIATITAAHPVTIIENRVYAADGSERWMQFVNRGLFDADGLLRELQSVGRDITERKRADDELAEYRMQLQALLESSDRSREDQRRDIAQDIHDQLGSALTAVSFRLDRLKHQAAGDANLVAEFDSIRALVSNAAASARDICTRLRPPLLDDLGLVAACRWYVDDWSHAVDVPARRRLPRLPHEPPDRLRTDIFRILQELLTNVARHSGARSVQVSLTGGRRLLRLRVSDDGTGFEPAAQSRGYGLAGVRERIARHGGRVDIASGTGGTIVAVSVPLAIPQ